MDKGKSENLNEWSDSKMKLDKIIISTLTFLLLSSCTTRQQMEQRERAENKASEESILTPESVSFEKMYESSPGDVVRIVFPHFYATKDGKLICKENVVPFYSLKGKIEAYVPISYFDDLKTQNCHFLVNNKKILVAEIILKEKVYPSETLNVDMRRVVLAPKDQKRVAREQVFLNQVYASSPWRPYFNQGFELPLDTHITSIYGARRIFNGAKQTQHLGTDFRAAIGVPIHTSNAGKVVVARELFYTGYTVTVDHGLGIFTIYGHLSEVKAVEGEFVPSGALIGLSGASGRVTGPHLHWGVRINGNFIDGHSLVRTSMKGMTE